MEPEFRFCLNGEVIRSIRVQHEMIDGEPIGKLQIAVEIEGNRVVHHRRQRKSVGQRPAEVRS